MTWIRGPIFIFLENKKRRSEIQFVKAHEQKIGRIKIKLYFDLYFVMAMLY